MAINNEEVASDKFAEDPLKINPLVRALENTPDIDRLVIVALVSVAPATDSPERAPIPPVKLARVVEPRVEEPVTDKLPVVVSPEVFVVVALLVEAYKFCAYKFVKFPVTPL